MTPKDHYLLLEELDPNDVTDISEAHKKMLLAQGLKPYRTSHNQIKWANTATQIYKLSQQSTKFHLFPRKKRSRHPGKGRRRHRTKLFVIIRDNWFFLFIVMLIAAGILYVLKYHIVG